MLHKKKLSCKGQLGKSDTGETILIFKMDRYQQKSTISHTSVEGTVPLLDLDSIPPSTTSLPGLEWLAPNPSNKKIISVVYTLSSRKHNDKS